MSDSNLTGAPYPLTLTDKEGKEHEFQAVAFLDKDLTALDNWVQSRVVSIARRSLKEQINSKDPDDAITQVEYNEQLGVAYKTALGVSIYDPEGIVVMNTPAGCARLGWQMTQKHHPKLEYDEMLSFCRNIDNQTEIFRASRLLNSGNVKEESEGDGKNAQGSE